MSPLLHFWCFVSLFGQFPPLACCSLHGMLVRRRVESCYSARKPGNLLTWTLVEIGIPCMVNVILRWRQVIVVVIDTTGMTSGHLKKVPMMRNIFPSKSPASHHVTQVVASLQASKNIYKGNELKSDDCYCKRQVWKLSTRLNDI